jgi:hypothetical protein
MHDENRVHSNTIISYGAAAAGSFSLTSAKALSLCFFSALCEFCCSSMSSNFLFASGSGLLHFCGDENKRNVQNFVQHACPE